MRETQIFGLNDIARKFLEENVKHVPCSPCPHCGKMTSTRMDKEEHEDARHVGMFDDGPMLHMYMLKNNSTIREVVQSSSWSSGPCIFLCLENEKGKRIGEWPAEEINNA